MRTLRISIPEPLHAELQELSISYKVSMAEILRSGANIMIDRYNRYRDAKQARPNIDKVLKEADNTKHE